MRTHPADVKKREPSKWRLLQGTHVTNVGVPVRIVDIETAVRKGVLVQADYDNTGRILIGNEFAQPLEMNAGDVMIIPIDDVSKIYFNVTVNGERINWVGS